MVLLLTDGEATEGETRAHYIAAFARQRVSQARFPVSVHSLAFGRGADMNLLRLVSAGSGGMATRIHDDADMDTQVSAFFKAVEAPLMTNLSLSYAALSCKSANCKRAACAVTEGQQAGGACRLTQPSVTSLYDGGILVHAGRLPAIDGVRAVALEVSVSGTVAMQDEPCPGLVASCTPARKPSSFREYTHIFHDASSGLQTGAKDIKKVWAQMSVSDALEACPLWSMPPPVHEHEPHTDGHGEPSVRHDTWEEDGWTRDPGCAYGVRGGRAGVLSLAKEAALDASIVTPFTSLVFVVNSTGSGLRCNSSATGNASAACNSSKSSDMDPKVSSDEAALSSGADSRRPKSSYAYAVLCWAVSVAFSCTMANSFW